MQYDIDGNDILLRQSDFALDDTLDCGQAFRWEKISDNAYRGAFLNRQLTVSCENDSDLFRLHDTTEEDFLGVWADYFDLGTDYGDIKRRFSEDETLSKACAFAGGIRLLRQDSWEALSSFIISQNNNIPRIKGIIGRLCSHYNGYPSAEDMRDETVDSLGYLRSGFRAKYIIDAAQKVEKGEVDFKKITESDIAFGREELIKIKGVGKKVAECTLLYGFGKYEAFPEDVWVKRIMAELYPDGMPECSKGYEGIAQQYLFHWRRNSERFI
jgi:N-glycosylase/DNA lyase